MPLSENRYPLFGGQFSKTHALIRKPVPTFRGHALTPKFRFRNFQRIVGRIAEYIDRAPLGHKKSDSICTPCPSRWMRQASISMPSAAKQTWPGPLAPWGGTGKAPAV